LKVVEGWGEIPRAMELNRKGELTASH